MKIVLEFIDNGPRAQPQWVATTEPGTAVPAVLGYTPIEVVYTIVEQLLEAGYNLHTGVKV